MKKKFKLTYAYILKIAAFFQVPLAVNGNSEFITIWDLSKPGSNPTEIKFQVTTTGTVNYTWETVTNTLQSGSGSFSGNFVTITGLPQNSVIRLKINPNNFRRFTIYNGPDRLRLIDVEQWGAVAWSSMEYAFMGCLNLNITATDLPNLSNVTSMSSMFYGCDILNGPSNIGDWNTSNVTNMSYMFYLAHNFNQPLTNWNTGKVTNFSSMFRATESFNQPLNHWNVSSAKNMSYMFYSSNFNQPLNNWDIRNVENISFMFADTKEFNQPLNNWDIRNITNVSFLFFNAQKFNQYLGSWVFNSNAYPYGFFDNSGLDCKNYSETLIAWANNPTMPSNITLGAFRIKYGTNAVAARQNLISNKGWTIVDDEATPKVAIL